MVLSALAVATDSFQPQLSATAFRLPPDALASVQKYINGRRGTWAGRRFRQVVCYLRRCSHLHGLGRPSLEPEPSLLEAYPTTLPQYEVVEHINVYQLASLHNLPRDLHIFG
jgi:hypothetical protein